ncbi:MAG TPA: hypothetical protein VF069_18520 [Streptosporangiaceae bacterium]
MDLKQATGMILTESAAHPDLLRVARSAYDDYAAGRTVHYTVLREMLYEASGKAVFGPIKRTYGEAAFEQMVLVLGREIDRQAPVPPRAHVR